MKKILICLLICVIAFSALAVSAFAAGGVTVTIEPSQSRFELTSQEDSPELTFTVKVQNNTGGGITALTIDIPHQSGFTYISDSYTQIVDGTLFADFNENAEGTNNYRIGCGFSNGKTGSSWDWCTFKVKVDNTAAKNAGSTTFNATAQTCSVDGASGTPFSCNPAVITVTHGTDAHPWQPSGESTATCTEAGTQHYTCACGAEKDENVDPLGHLNLTAGDFTFGNADGQNSNAKIHVKCGRAGCEYYGGGSGVDLTEADDEVTVTPDTKGVSCGQPGKVTYTAKLEITDKNTSGGKLAKTGATTVDTGEPLKHTFQPTQVVWGDGASVSGTKKCSLCGKEFTGTGTATTVTDEKPTCTTPGKSHREATLTFTPASDDSAAWNDADKTEKVTTQDTPDVIPALGHDMTAVFDWDGTTADSAKVTVTVTCARESCDYHGGVQISEGDLLKVSVDKTDAQCGKPGTVTYTATVTIDGWSKSEDDPIQTDALNHDWELDPNAVIWEPADAPTKATAARVCKVCGQKSASVTVEGSAITSTQTKAPSCETGGSAAYSASFTFTDDFTSQEQQQPVTVSKTVDLPALGHKWDTATATWTWDGADDVYDNTAPTAKVKVMCLNAGKCDSKYDTDGLVIDAKVEPDDTLSTVPTCTTGGAVTFNATAVTTDHFEGTEQKAETFTSSTKETYTALGHDFQGKPVVEWPASVDGTNPPEIKEAKLYCAREKTDVVTQATRVVNEIKDDPAKWADPTYQAPGKRTYTVTAQFGTGIGDKITYATTDEKTYELPQLAPQASKPEPEVNASGVTVKDTPAADVIQTQVQNALQGSASGLDAKLAAELKDRGDSTTSGMTVKTKLVVAPKTDPTVAPVTDAGTKLAATYDIHIDVTVTGGGITQPLTGNIEQTEDPISFSVPKPEGGPIYIVMRYHDGQWQTIPSAVNGDNIEFSSDRFSEFAILSSNDLKYAVIDPIPDQTYTGSEIRPAVKVTINGGTELTAGTDYTVEYADNVNVGTAAVTIKAVENGGYTGSQTVNFRIVEKPAAGGSGSGSGTKNAPATGDETPVALYAGILALSATALAVVCFRRKKSH